MTSKTKSKNGINRRHSRKTEQTVLSRYNILKKFRKTEVLVTSEIRAQRVRQQYRKLQRKRALQADNPKKLSFSVEISLMLYIIPFFETTKCHFLVVQVIFVKRSDGQLAGRDKVILNISHALRVPDNRIRSSLQTFVTKKLVDFLSTLLSIELFENFKN